MDCRGISDEDYKYMMHWLVHEGNVAVINYMKEEGIDLRRNPVEFGTYHPTIEGKIWINEKAETSVEGLYAAGDESMGGIGPSATYGWIAGENAATYARKSSPPDVGKSRSEIEERKSLIQEIRSRREGPDWKEANIALQQIMQDYAGPVRSATLLEAGLSYLRRLRTKARATLMARNQWELTRCLETLNLLDLGELVFVAAQERKETRLPFPLFGFTLDTTMAVVSLIFQGVLEKFPRLKLIYAHLGGVVPYLVQRMEDSFRSYSREWGFELSKTPSEYYRSQVYIDCISFHLPALRCALDFMGVEHILLGTDYAHPVGDPERAIASVRELGLPEGETLNILGGNAARVFGLG